MVMVMCEANAYVVKDGREELFLEALDTVEPLVSKPVDGSKSSYKGVKRGYAKVSTIDQ